MVSNLWRHRSLIKQLTKREVVVRYRGSYLGVLWSFINPLFMLTIYTFVFSSVFKARWGVSPNESKVEFAIILFTGMIVFTLFSEVVSRAPMLVTGNVNYVKKVVFPLEVLPMVIVGSALINAAISLVVLLLAIVVLMGTFQWTLVFLPLVVLPLILLTLGLGWFLSALGVYLRDIGQIIGVVVQVLMFMSPIFYPVSAVPKAFQGVFYVNPLSYVIEDMRRILIWGQMPNWTWLLIGTLISMVVAWLGHLWFQRTRGGFADVL